MLVRGIEQNQSVCAVEQQESLPEALKSWLVKVLESIGPASWVLTDDEALQSLPSSKASTEALGRLLKGKFPASRINFVEVGNSQFTLRLCPLRLLTQLAERYSFIMGWTVNIEQGYLASSAEPREAAVRLLSRLKADYPESSPVLYKSRRGRGLWAVKIALQHLASWPIDMNRIDGWAAQDFLLAKYKLLEGCCIDGGWNMPPGLAIPKHWIRPETPVLNFFVREVKRNINSPDKIDLLCQEAYQALPLETLTLDVWNLEQWMRQQGRL